MIAKIQPSNPNLEAAVNYNENKITTPDAAKDYQDKTLNGIGDGYVLATRNVPENASLLEVFKDRKLLSLKKKRSGPLIKEYAFHMSVNPSENDRKLSDEEAVDLIDEMMEALSYKNQPYRIYKHTDIERHHYHVVSCRIDENGKKINDSFNWYVLREALKKLAPKYGFSLVLSEEEKRNQSQEAAPMTSPVAGQVKKPETGPTKEEKKFVPAFSRKNGPVIAQLREITQDALKWHFSTFEQYQSLLLRRYNVLVEVQKGEMDSETLVLSGTDTSGRPITTPLAEQELNLGLLRQIQEKISKEKMRNRREQRERIEKLTRAAARIAKSYEEFKALMERKGSLVVLSFNRNNEPFGVTYLDKATKCAWKGSETAVDLKWLMKLAQEKGWVLTDDKRQEALVKRQSLPSRKKTIIKIQDPHTTDGDTPQAKEIRSIKLGPTVIRKGSGAGPLVPGNRTHGSTKQAGDGKEERRKDIDDDRPVQLVR